jgi:hypothetical protein
MKNLVDNSRTVRYTVTGTCGVADIYRTNETGGTDNLNDESLPWEYMVEMTPGDWVYLGGGGWEGGSITATIYVDGDKKETKTGSGETFCNASVGLFID